MFFSLNYKYFLLETLFELDKTIMNNKIILLRI